MTIFDIKPGTLLKLKTEAIFYCFQNSSEKYELVGLEEGECVLYLGYETIDVHIATFKVKLLYKNKILFDHVSKNYFIDNFGEISNKILGI